MNKHNLVRAGLALALTAILLLSGCGDVVLTADVAPVSGTPLIENLPENRITVATVDELIAAIGSDRVIELAEATFDLSAASSYHDDTGNDCAYWAECYDGWELHISSVRNLCIIGQGAEKSSIVTAPRYANVLNFDWSADVTLSDFTAGHTEEPGYCSGGVLYFSNCERMNVKACDLYGCGTIGVSAFNSRGIYAEDTVVHDCSYGALEAYNSYDFRFVGGKLVNCGQKGEDGGYSFLSAQGCTGFAVLNTEIAGNRMECLLSSGNSRDVTLRGCSVHDNSFGKASSGDGYANYSGAVFHITGESPVVDDCGFVSNAYGGAGLYYNYDGESAGVALDANGAALTLAALDAMEQKEYTGVIELAPSAAPAGEVDENGVTVYHVQTADEFLAALGSYTTIYVDAELLDLSEAASYGGYGSDAYYWENRYDGPSLVISGLRNLRIIGQGKDATTIQAVPRYADVLRFEYCSNISVEELTAGHLREAPGSCSGDVLTFLYCDEVLVRGCGLFGCGVNGISADGCTGFAVEDSVLYECSNSGAVFYNCDGVSFIGCKIRDCGYNGVYSGDCRNVTWEGKKLLAGWTKVA